MDILPTKADRVTLADFEEMLADKPDDEKWELIDGRVYKSMVGAAWEHHVIIANIDHAISPHLRATGLPCRVFRESFYLKKDFDDLAALPDVMVRCGPLKPGQTSIDDPLILFEVVSKGSQARDRMSKRVAYQSLPSLQHYILVERDSVLIDHYVRRDDGWYGEPPLETFGATLKLSAIDFDITAAEIYRDVIAG
jgi:Uma2 family endonuclease